MLCYSCERGYFLIFLPALSVTVADAAIRDPMMLEGEEVPAFGDVMSLTELTLGMIVDAVALEEVVWVCLMAELKAFVAGAAAYWKVQLRILFLERQEDL